MLLNTTCKIAVRKKKAQQLHIYFKNSLGKIFPKGKLQAWMISLVNAIKYSKNILLMYTNLFKKYKRGHHGLFHFMGLAVL